MPKERTKQRRSTRACDFCHSRGVRCRQSDTANPPPELTCTTCIEYGEPCTWNQAPKKRGTKSGTASTAGTALSWKQKVSENRVSMSSLIDVYLDTIHPVFPLYCERELWVGWRNFKFPTSSSEYTSLIALCALSAQHASQGSLFEPAKIPQNLAADVEPYLTEAVDSFGKQQHESFNLEYIRACGFLTLLGIQIGSRSMLHKYLGIYHGICARFGLHDEDQWTERSNMSVCEVETRRRLYWAMYRLEVHSACVLGHMIRLPENQSNVGYPAGLHHPAFVSGRDGEFEDWFTGWNTTTDLCRILEHAIIEFRSTRRHSPYDNTQIAPAGELSLHQRLSKVQVQAIPRFSRAFDQSADCGRNRCGFQATNILFTIHMIRMFLATGSPAKMLKAAEMLLDGAKTVPTAYIRASGVRLMQELAGTGLMLGSVAAQKPTPSDQLNSLINIQITLAEFLERQSVANMTARSSVIRLREQIIGVSSHSLSSN